MDTKPPIDPRSETAPSLDFVRTIITQDTQSGKYQGCVHTRFPPEPNGYLHIGHAKSINLNFGVAQEFGGLCNLRFDDTNPTKEEVEYVEAIQEDIHWLGYDWQNRLYYASDYFDRLYLFAEELIEKSKAFVCDLSPEELRVYRGTLTEPGRNSPYRDRSVAENLDLFRRMKAGEFAEGARTLRAKIDMSSPNIVMRDPVIYRILKTPHHRTGTKWFIYPMYDFAHCLSDALEGITHSICTLEFENNHALYDWLLDNLVVPGHPLQIEFARLNLNYVVMSKRKLRRLVEEGVVAGWDDPRMPTLAGYRRRGYTPEAIRDFCDRIGVAKASNVVDYSLLEYCIRNDLNKRAPRVMAVLKPLKVIIDNYLEGLVEDIDAINNPEDLNAGTRKVPFSREIYIEQDDFRETPPPKYFRLAPGREVRLRYAYFIKCTGIVKDQDSNVIEVHCTYDPATRGGDAPDGRKVKATLHWVSAAHALEAQVNQYDRLFSVEDPDNEQQGHSFIEYLNPNSLEVVQGCKIEPSVADALPLTHYQFERQGYFCVDPDSRSGKLIFNRTVALKDTWAKIEEGSKS